MNIGAKIKYVREERGMTQEELAEDAGTSRHKIIQIEKGAKITPLEFSKILKSLRVPTIQEWIDLTAGVS